MDKLQKHIIYIVLDMVLKHRWLIIIPFCLSMAVGIVAAIILPKTYEAETLILVESQKVPDQYVKSIISTDISRRINTISEQIKSRTYLEKIIEQYDLFSEPDQKDMFLEDKLQAMRKNINVRVTRSGQSMDSFKIAFRGKDPVKVMNIANSLASYFIDQSIQVMEQEAIGTSSFLEGELEEMRKQLEMYENSLKEFRERHMGELPSDLNSLLRSLDRLQLNLGDKQEELREAKNRLLELEREIEDAKQKARARLTMIGNQAEIAGENASVDESDPRVRLAKAKALLDKLLLRYTEKHPDIVKVKEVIANLEEKVAEAPLAPESPEKADEDATKTTDSDIYVSSRPELLTQYEATKREIDQYEKDIQRILKQIKLFEKRVENVPKREVELLSLTRNYDNIKSAYESLLSRKLEAEIAVSMERKAKGERFRILDSAKKPQKPISPDMRKLFVLFTGAGLGTGGGLIFLLFFLNTSIKAIEEVKDYVRQDAVLITIPKIRHWKDKMLLRSNLVLSLSGSCLAIVLFAVFGALSFKGVDATTAFLNKFVDINKYISMMPRLK